ncbi:unnamed protein product [Fusarium venenatum]|uniref:Uncharacterized protein n=1 Tax=Fusarium venenatum TaxID=56646 RepID=A0A2L2TEL2_9HYPO|nr:uncharacterized protein FVRRES_07273 [Fusarium venenatum]CEI62837.1 unnamed protein product [Fusarium venenatum]
MDVPVKVNALSGTTSGRYKAPGWHNPTAATAAVFGSSLEVILFEYNHVRTLYNTAAFMRDIYPHSCGACHAL